MKNAYKYEQPKYKNIINAYQRYNMVLHDYFSKSKCLFLLGNHTIIIIIH